jgi:hypothetical protein
MYGITQSPDTNYIFIFQEEFFEEYCAICNKRYTNVEYKWCKPCNFTNWVNGNEEFDNFIQLKINKPSKQRETKFEFIPYNQFDKIKKIGKGDFITVHSATWQNKVALACFNNSQNFLNKVRNF